jgi:hypothetical protein
MSHTVSISPDPGCNSCGGEGWVVGAEYMGAVEHIPCDCIARRCDGCEQRVEQCACEAKPDEQRPEIPHGHAMLPNDSHPGPGCSCLSVLAALLLSACSTCREHPAFCSVAVSVAATCIKLSQSHHQSTTSQSRLPTPRVDCTRVDCR